MINPAKKLKNAKRRNQRRKAIMGAPGKRIQDLRTVRPHDPGKEAVRRVGEYKAAVRKKKVGKKK
jgi:hypothetical protein